jgi:hypothetical protein
MGGVSSIVHINIGPLLSLSLHPLRLFACVIIRENPKMRTQKDVLKKFHHHHTTQTQTTKPTPEP